MNVEELKPRYTVKDIQMSYDAEKAKEELYGEWVAHYIYRPLSFRITPFFLYFGYSPSKVTFIALILALSLPFIALFLPMPYLFIGVIAIVVAVLDCVDGNIARVTGQVSKSGQYFDFLTDILHRIALYLAIGIVINQGSWTPDFFVGVASECLLIAAMLAIVARMCRVYADNELIAVEKHQIKDDHERGSSGWLDDYFFPFFSGLDWALPIAVLIFGFFGLLHWVLIWLLFYSLLDFFNTQYSIFSKLQ